MTREEQIVEYANSFKGKGIESDELKEIVHLAIIDGAKWADAHPQEPSLPSNLDEAEFEYAQSLDEIPANQEEEKMIYDAFKAGAKWMAKQGVILNLSIDEFSCGAYNACVEQGLTSEDDVIIQIRKK